MTPLCCSDIPDAAKMELVDAVAVPGRRKQTLKAALDALRIYLEGDGRNFTADGNETRSLFFKKWTREERVTLVKGAAILNSNSNQFPHSLTWDDASALTGYLKDRSAKAIQKQWEQCRELLRALYDEEVIGGELGLSGSGDGEADVEME